MRYTHCNKLRFSYSSQLSGQDKISKLLVKPVLLVFLIITGLTGCTAPPDSDFYEVDGLLTGNIADSVTADGWKPVHFINSRGLAIMPADTAEIRSLIYSVYISTPGRYAFWLLATYPDLGSDSAKVDVSITGPDNFLKARAWADIPQQYSLQWQRVATGTNSNLILFDEPGQYEVAFTAPGSADIQLHKFQMSLNNADEPSGLGLPSSIRTDLSSADLFREIPVMLPPAWVFKPILGFDTDSLNHGEQLLIEESAAMSAEPGGVWTLSDSDTETIDISKNKEDRALVRGVKVSFDAHCVSDLPIPIKQEVGFFVTQNSPGADCLSRLHQQYQDAAGDDLRSVFFHGITNAFNAEIKQYPAPVTPEYEFNWSAAPRAEGSKFRPGGFAELVNDLSDPAGSLFNTLFLSMPVGYPDSLSDNAGWDSELFIRSVQLSTFMPVMHLILPGDIDLLSTQERRQLLDAMYLRNSIFPYSYTHAHYTRQTNESVISGFRQYPDQFMYGDVFLVAPVVKPGMDGRLVYFPEGRLWYNYFTGESFKAGQSWFVETQLERMPLFVRAGAVIPYQTTGYPELLKIEIYTGNAGAFRLVEDDGLTRAYRRTVAARTMLRYNEVEGNLTFTIGAVQGGFEGMNHIRSYDIHFKHTEMPERIEINSEELVRAAATGGDDSGSWRFGGEESEIILSLKNQSRYEKLDIVIYY